MIHRRSRPRVPCRSPLLCSISILLIYFPALISAAVVTLDSIEIFRTHEWLPFNKPKVYFKCRRENATALPDVKEKNVSYAFKGEESWQPLTELQDIKCKRCGFYVKHSITSDDIFEEWEFCASAFNRSDGKYTHFKNREINATFLCPDCVPLVTASSHSTKPNNVSNEMQWALIVVISGLASIVLTVGILTGYLYWQKRKKQQEQARFLKLYQEIDDVEEELGIGPLSHRTV